MRKLPVNSLLGNNFLAIDIGARGDIPQQWFPLDGIVKIISFDADKHACDELRRKYASRGNSDMYDVHAVALGKADEIRTLYLTKGRGGSSLYRPNTDFIKEYVNVGYCLVEKEIEIETRHSGNYFQEIDVSNADLLKIDIQGAELEVLQNFSSNLISSLLFIQTEIQFHNRQNGAPTFTEIHKYLTNNGFELLDLASIHQHPTTDGSRDNTVSPFGVVLDSPSIDSRIWYGDALYFRPYPKESSKIRNLIVCLCLYGFFTEAFKIAQQSHQQGNLTEDELQLMIGHIVSWHSNSRLRYRYRNSIIARSIQWLLKYFNLKENPPYKWDSQ